MSASVSRKPSAKCRARAVADGVGDRVDEELEPARAAASRAEGDDGGEVAAGAVAADGDPLRVGAELGGVLGGLANAASASSTAAGNGARARAGSRPRAPAAPFAARTRQVPSWVSRSPSTQPPPWK